MTFCVPIPTPPSKDHCICHPNHKHIIIGSQQPNPCQWHAADTCPTNHQTCCALAAIHDDCTCCKLFLGTWPKYALERCCDASCNPGLYGAAARDLVVRVGAILALRAHGAAKVPSDIGQTTALFCAFPTQPSQFAQLDYSKSPNGGSALLAHW